MVTASGRELTIGLGALALVAFAGCELVVVDESVKLDDGGTPPPAGDAVSARIGPEGGALEHPSGASIVIPRGALSSTLTIGLARGSADDVPAAPPDGVTLGGTVYSVTPHGTRFARPVTLTLPRTSEQNLLMRADGDASTAWEPVAPGYAEGFFVLETDHFSHFAPSVQLMPGTGFRIVPEMCEFHGVGEPGVGESSVIPYLCGASPGLFTPNGSLHQLVARFPDALDIDAFAADVGRGILDVQLRESSPVFGVQYAWITSSGGERQFIGRIPRENPLIGCQRCGLPCPDFTTLVLPPGSYTLTVESYGSDQCTQSNFNPLICPEELTAETAMLGRASVSCSVVRGACNVCSAVLGPAPPVSTTCDAMEGPQPPCGADATCNRTDCVTFDGITTGTHCGEPTSQQLDVVNDCGEPLAIKYCFWSTSLGRWDCGIDSTFDVGNTLPGAWTCQGNGRFYYAAMPIDEYLSGSSSCAFGRFPDE